MVDCLQKKSANKHLNGQSQAPNGEELVVVVEHSYELKKNVPIVYEWGTFSEDLCLIDMKEKPVNDECHG